jgi:hypothetical protein
MWLASAVSVLSACSFGATSLPQRLGDQEYWRLVTELSEPAGAAAFTHSENLVSNEALYAHTLRRLGARGGAYIGVGPEQNFSYIATLRPAMAFIVDIRRENRNLHLMYKALFETSRDRAEFVSALFARERPQGLARDVPVADLFAAYDTVRPAATLYERNAERVLGTLIESHGFPLDGFDVGTIERALHAFYSDGPDIHYGRSLAPGDAGPSYRALMTATDAGGESRSYLASEEAFAFVKDLHARNLIVPLVGDFSGPHTLRAAGEYIRRHRASVEAFYGSNVEVYLNRAKVAAFCGNLAMLPYRVRTPFIDNKGLQLLRAKVRTCTR